MPPSIRQAIRAKEEIMKKAKYLKKNNSDVKFDKIIESLEFDNKTHVKPESRKNEKIEI